MSWLVVALIPGLLMLATLGLARMEASLDTAAARARGTAESVGCADPAGVEPSARDSTTEVPEVVHRRLADEFDYLPSSAEWATDQFRAGAFALAVARSDDPGQSQPNRQFGPRQHAHRV